MPPLYHIRWLEWDFTLVLFHNCYWSRHAIARLARCAVALIGGLSIIPSMLLLFFYTKGSLAPFLYQTIGHNVLPNLGLWSAFYTRVLIFPVSLVLLCLIARGIISHSSDPRQITRRVFVLFVGGIYCAALEAFFPLMEHENYLPFYPLLFVVITPLVLKVLSIRRSSSPAISPVFYPSFMFVVTSFCAVMEFGSVVGLGALWKDNTLIQTGMLNEVLRLTSPKDFVADLKGETIFRPRSSFYVLERVTRVRIRRGLLPDDIPERLITTRTCVATLDNPKFPHRARTFLNRNYLSVGHLRVVGQLLPVPSGSIPSIPFDVQIPARYVIVCQDCTPSGLLDNIPYDGERFLEAGHHVFQPSFPPWRRFALLWGKAHKLGFSPFAENTSSHGTI